MDDCIFCKIINGAVPSSKVFEDEDFIAFLDIMPLNKGHTLVVPKKHCETIDDMPEQILAKIGPALKTLSRAVAAAAGATGVNLILSNGKTAGQLVPHFHFHIIPRREGDGLHFDTHRKKYAGNEMEQYRDKIISARTAKG